MKDDNDNNYCHQICQFLFNHVICKIPEIKNYKYMYLKTKEGRLKKKLLYIDDYVNLVFDLISEGLIKD